MGAIAKTGQGYQRIGFRIISCQIATGNIIANQLESADLPGNAIIPQGFNFNQTTIF